MFNLTCLLCLMVAVSGCNKKEKKEESKSAEAPATIASELIAVIDLNRVAQEIGAQAKIDLSLKNKEQELLTRFNGLKAELSRRVTELKSGKSDLNDQKQNELDQMTVEHQNKLTLQAQVAQSQLLAHHSGLKQKLLSDIRPVAYQVARDKGMQIVLTVGQVYAAGPQVNITSDVVTRIKEINEKNAVSQKSEPETPRVAVLPHGGEFTPR